MDKFSGIGSSSPLAPSAAQAGLAGTPGREVKTGVFRGDNVVAVEKKSELGSAAEEISMHFSEKVEKRDSDEMEVQVPSHIQLMEIDQIKEYLDRAKALSEQGKLEKLAEQIIQAGGLTAGRTARETFPTNESHQFALLQYAYQTARQQGAPEETQGHILDAIHFLCQDAETETRIYAGINSVEAAVKYGKATGKSSGQDITHFQRTYADVVLAGHRLDRTLTLMLEKFNGLGDHFEKAMENMMAALGADMAAARSSVVDNDYLFVLGTGLQKLKDFNTQLENASHLLARCGLESQH